MACRKDRNALTNNRIATWKTALAFQISARKRYCDGANNEAIFVLDAAGRDVLMDVAYNDQVRVDDRTIDSHIKRLRKRFRSTDGAFDMIETLYGVGYRFKEL